MEARFGAESYHFYGVGVGGSSDLRGVGGSTDLGGMGKRPSEWDLNDWRWDGDLFIASRLNMVLADGVGVAQQFFPLGSGVPVTGGPSNSSSSCSEEVDLPDPKGNKEGEKKMRVIVLEDDGLNEEAGTLTLKLGGLANVVADREIASLDDSNRKKSRAARSTSNRAVVIYSSNFTS